jgi:hypothetical protein
MAASSRAVPRHTQQGVFARPLTEAGGDTHLELVVLLALLLRHTGVQQGRGRHAVLREAALRARDERLEPKQRRGVSNLGRDREGAEAEASRGREKRRTCELLPSRNEFSAKNFSGEPYSSMDDLPVLVAVTMRLVTASPLSS